MGTVEGHWYRFNYGDSPPGASAARGARAGRAARPRGCPGLNPWLPLQVLLLPCDGSQAQRWWDNFRAVEEKTWEPGESRTRLRASNGLYLSARDGVKSDGAELTTYSHGDISRRDIQYAGPGDNIARIKGIDTEGDGGRDGRRVRHRRASALGDRTVTP
ncbi:hypothetical protein [Streptomyces sp. NRRL S-920]|uniref:hypothetical protein n=1 Tax=Streptomyces sp. NRRL S-920 TaxID=1463921 RepID=UPI0004C754D6|nr:hypothetical protein [Streptomyces sp. NRRL S-920]